MRHLSARLHFSLGFFHLLALDRIDAAVSSPFSPQAQSVTTIPPPPRLSAPNRVYSVIIRAAASCL
jgi:hypothetical protein